MRWLIALILSVALLAAWKFLSRQVLASKSEPKSVEATAPITMKTLRGEPIPTRELEPSENDIPKDCSAQWEKIAVLSLRAIQEDLKKGAMQINAACKKYDLAGDQSDQVYAACQYEPQRGLLSDEKVCLAMIALYRSLWIDHLTPGQKDFRSMSLQLLANKILAGFQDVNLHPERKAELIAMIKALTDRQPNFPDAQKALVTAMALNLGTSDYSPDEMKGLIEKALAMNPNDPQLQEADLLNEQIRGNSGYAIAFVAQNPEAGLGYYYRAWGEWQARDKDAALGDLRRAAQLLPQDARIAKTLAEVEQNRVGNLFSTTIGFNFGDL